MKPYNILILALCAIIGLSATGCSDELFGPSDIEDVVEGKPASIRFDVQIGESLKVTRGDMSEGRDCEIVTVWIGFFDAKSKKLKHSRLLGAETFGTGKDVDEHELDNSIVLNGEKGKENEHITSGRYIIAAVANPVGNYGVMKSANKSESSRTELDDLLGIVETFEDFRGIAVMRGDGSAGSIGTPSGNLPMQGVFVPSGTDCNFKSNSSAVSEFFDTQSKNAINIHPSLDSNNPTLIDGAIHFRRLISQNKFEITHGDNVSKMEIVQARVYNVPVLSWLAERADDVIPPDVVNAGDISGIREGGDATTDPNKAQASNNYLTSTRIMGNTMTKTIDAATKKDTYSFDWWQLENRRTGNSTTYETRETEKKDAAGLNSGVYTALLEDGNISNNNCATFLELRVRMQLEKTDGAGALGAGSQLTEAEAVYTIHLGACEGTGTDKYKDFRCRRNTKYSYKVTINGVDKIIVEAMSSEEVESGAEGTVTFVTEKFYQADAHYCVFNVELTDDERMSADWIMRVYTNATTSMEIATEKATDETRGKTINPATLKADMKYWDWIILRPTSGENIVADFKPVGFDLSKETDKSKSFYLTDIRNVMDYPKHSSGSNYYTVFVNEYVYRSDSDKWKEENTENAGMQTDNWSEYVNLPDRTFWLKVVESRSEDKESAVLNSKYAIRQKSIQSFADISRTGVATLGMEHRNETVFTGTATNHSTAAYGDNPKGDTSEIYARKRNTNYLSGTWKSWLSNEFYSAVVNEGVQNLASADPKMASACINRNRDLDGDGDIQTNEIRWVLPDKQIYTMMFAAYSALESPLFDFKNVPAEYNQTVEAYGGNAWQYMANFHYACMDGDMFWAEEGCSTGSFGKQAIAQRYPNQVRCVRYLGTDMSSIPDTDPVAQPFEKDKDNNIISVHLSKEALRDEFSTSMLVSHTLGSELMKPFKQFEYYAPTNLRPNGFASNNQPVSYNNPAIGNISDWWTFATKYNPCSSINSATNGYGWRMPSIVEVAAMFYAAKNNLSFNSYIISNTYELNKTRWCTAMLTGDSAMTLKSWDDVSDYPIVCVRDKQ